jgi:hypothetical protein
MTRGNSGSGDREPASFYRLTVCKVNHRFQPGASCRWGKEKR